MIAAQWDNQRGRDLWEGHERSRIHRVIGEEGRFTVCGTIVDPFKEGFKIWLLKTRPESDRLCTTCWRNV